MASFLVRRAAWSVAVIAIVWLVTFVLAFMVPADPARAIAGVHASAEDVARLRVALGLDQPLPVQLALHFGRLVTGDLGYSFQFRRPVLDLILARLPATIELAAGALLVEVVIGIPLGIVAATRRARFGDRFATLFSGLAAAFPTFWLGYLLKLALAFLPAVALGVTIFPIGGYELGSPSHLVLPALTLGLVGSASYVRLMRASLLDELGQAYLVTARSKGLSERQVLVRHALRNALGPVIAQLGLDMGLLLGGVVVVENVFSWPGIGRLALDGITHGDLPVILGTVAVGTLFILLGNLVADVLNATLDPRIREAGL